VHGDGVLVHDGNNAAAATVAVYAPADHNVDTDDRHIIVDGETPFCILARSFVVVITDVPVFVV